MVIQHNLPALNSLRANNKNTHSLSKSLKKMSSGYKINRAGDDAAGLAVSEKMRSQIARMSQAVELEYLHLCDEVDQIAETDFKGVVMLTGGGVSEWLENEVSKSVIAKSNTVSAAKAINVSNTAAKSSAVTTSASNNAVKRAVASYANAAPIAETVTYAAANRTGGVACGDFTVYGDSNNYSFSGSVLTILGGDVIVEGKCK